MDYSLVITRREKNPDYDPKADYRYSNNQPQPVIEINCLSVVISNEQFEAIRKAVLEKF